MLETRTSVLAAARELAHELIPLRHALHRHPEIGLDLPRTKRTLLDALSGLDLQIHEHSTTSGVVASLRGVRPGRTLLLRADMDALPVDEDVDVDYRSQIPGVMHACGHDAHTAMLVGAARLLARHRHELAGEIRFMFQPGEEGYFGALRMLEEGLLDLEPPVDAAFALHVEPRLPVGLIATRAGPVLASTDDLRIVVHGRGGHACMPHDAADPIVVASELVLAMQTWLTRNVSAFDPVVLTIARISAGTTANVIPETAELEGTLRAISEAARQHALAGVRKLSEGLVAAHGLRAEFQLRSGYPVLVNDSEFVGCIVPGLRSLLGESSMITMSTPVMGGEDFSYVLQRVPGAMVFLGAREDGLDGAAPCHSNRMRLNDSALAVGAAVHVAVAEAYLGPLGFDASA